VEIKGTIEAPDGSYEPVSALGNTCEEALTGKIPEGYKLLAIRTDR